ncbi:MAG: cation diffusion facilitator family transporter [Thermoanaerobacteraceae bacterium]|nr:cation diffusion facilitator family transporter [Thermoanaerobacteraceae bacterium]
MDTYKNIFRVNLIILIFNILVCILKIATGYLINSMSMIADGFHSLTDASSNVIGLIGISFAYRPSDEKHPYGHKKIETMVTLIIGAMLVLVCYEVIAGAVERIKNPVQVNANIYSFAIMIITIAVNLFVTNFEKKKARELKSDFLESDSIHTASDVLVSLSVIAGLVFARYGVQIADVIVSIFIVIMIGRAAFEIFSRSTSILVDAVVLDEEGIEQLVKSVDGVRSCHKIRTRGREDDIKVDLHVLVNEDMSVLRAHEISDIIEENLKRVYPGITDVTIHIEPEEDIRNK